MNHSMKGYSMNMKTIEPDTAGMKCGGRQSWRRLGRFAAAAALVAGLAPAGAAAQEERILQWPGAGQDAYPRLYVSREDVTRLKQRRGDLLARVKGNTQWTFGPHGEGNLMIGALLLEDELAQRTALNEALENMGTLIARIPDTTVRKAGAHSYSQFFGRAVAAADVALASSRITAQERALLVSRIAQAAYMVNDPNYWDLKTTANLCPNITTAAYYYRMTLAALIPSHPRSKVWFDAAWAEISREIDAWQDPAGGMQESPHYSGLLYDYWVGACLIARNAGVPNHGRLFDPQMRKAALWLANISTPRDVRHNGHRRLPSLGHTYANESSGCFGLLASLWKTHDPTFAAEMQWMYLEHGSPLNPGILSYYPAMMGYRELLKSDPPAPRQPQWTSACYSETGVLMRNTIGGERETMLYLIAGRNHSHYFNDSGSITLWGKGRELSHEDSYDKRRVHDKTRHEAIDARSVHSMADGPAVYNAEAVMAIREFSTSAHLDYTRGTRQGWHRQIAMVKDPDPLGPNYFVIADTFDAASVPTDWRLFLLANQIHVQSPRVTVTGKDDVDMDIVFTRPNRVVAEARNEHLFVRLDKPGTLTSVLYPRLKNQPPPQVTPIADGRGVKVVTTAGVDYVFLDTEPFNFAADGVNFEGRVGVIKVRGAGQVASIPGPSDVAAGWEGGDRELRMIPWEGAQYPPYPYDFMKDPPDR